VVADLDRSSVSREHVRRLMADGTLERVGEEESAEAAEEGLQSGRTSAAVVIPEALARPLPRRADLGAVIIDGSDPNRSTVAAATVARYFAEAARGSRASSSPRAACPPPSRRPRSPRASGSTRPWTPRRS
jgi:ABC-2 type transport system permease protein